VVEGIDLRGRRSGRTVIFFADDAHAHRSPSGALVLPLDQAAMAVRVALGDIEEVSRSARKADV
jgi:hypothetical protein